MDKTTTHDCEMLGNLTNKVNPDGSTSINLQVIALNIKITNYIQ